MDVTFQKSGLGPVAAVSRALAVGVIAASLLYLPADAKAERKKKKPAQPACVGEAVLQAAQLRIIQTELMVAGLSCKTYDRWTQTANTTRYNEFVTAYKPVLMNDAHKVLARHFKSEQRLNDFLTRLANDSSQRSLSNIVEFCDGASKMYDEVLVTPSVQLAQYSAAKPQTAQHGLNVCPEVLQKAASAGPALAAAGTPATASVAAVRNPPKPQLKPEI